MPRQCRQINTLQIVRRRRVRDVGPAGDGDSGSTGGKCQGRQDRLQDEGRRPRRADSEVVSAGCGRCLRGEPEADRPDFCAFQLCRAQACRGLD